MEEINDKTKVLQKTMENKPNQEGILLSLFLPTNSDHI